ncbi:MAG: hypothetical protein EPN20_08580, partial [Magnetospirillum sp.]
MAEVDALLVRIEANTALLRSELDKADRALSSSAGTAEIMAKRIDAAMAGSGKKAQQSAASFAEAMEQQRASMQRFLDQADPTGAAMRRLADTQAEVNRALAYGTVTQGEHAKIMTMLGTTATRTGGQLRTMRGFTEVYFGDELVTFDADHKAIGRWAGFARCWIGTGSIAGDADLQTALEAACPGVWTSEHRQYGRAKVYVEFTYDQKMFPSGIPQISCVVRGKKVYDPRTDTTAYSDNAVLCLRDYLTTRDVGLGVMAYELLAADVNSSANVCDETVSCIRSQLIPQGEGTVIGDMTGNDGLAAAFDGTSSTSQSHSAYSSAAIGSVGKHWSAPRKIGRVMAYPPSSGGWSQGWTGNVTLSLRGSDDGSTWVTLCSETVTDAESQQVPWNPDSSAITTTTAYAYHDLRIDATGSGDGVYCAEVRLYELVGTETRYTCNGTVDSD